MMMQCIPHLTERELDAYIDDQQERAQMIDAAIEVAVLRTYEEKLAAIRTGRYAIRDDGVELIEIDVGSWRALTDKFVVARALALLLFLGIDVEPGEGAAALFQLAAGTREPAPRRLIDIANVPSTPRTTDGIIANSFPR